MFKGKKRMKYNKDKHHTTAYLLLIIKFENFKSLLYRLLLKNIKYQETTNSIGKKKKSKCHTMAVTAFFLCAQSVSEKYWAHWKVIIKRPSPSLPQNSKLVLQAFNIYWEIWTILLDNIKWYFILWTPFSEKDYMTNHDFINTNFKVMKYKVPKSTSKITSHTFKVL